LSEEYRDNCRILLCRLPDEMHFYDKSFLPGPAVNIILMLGRIVEPVQLRFIIRSFCRFVYYFMHNSFLFIHSSIRLLRIVPQNANTNTLFSCFGEMDAFPIIPSGAFRLDAGNQCGIKILFNFYEINYRIFLRAPI